MDKELLLHSTSHRALDLTAREEEARGSKPMLKHYIGVYDPKTGRLEVVEAKRMVVRGQVRAKQLPNSSAEGGSRVVRLPVENPFVELELLTWL